MPLSCSPSSKGWPWTPARLYLGPGGAPEPGTRRNGLPAGMRAQTGWVATPLCDLSSCLRLSERILPRAASVALTTPSSMGVPHTTLKAQPPQPPGASSPEAGQDPTTGQTVAGAGTPTMQRGPRTQPRGWAQVPAPKQRGPSYPKNRPRTRGSCSSVLGTQPRHSDWGAMALRTGTVASPQGEVRGTTHPPLCGRSTGGFFVLLGPAQGSGEQGPSHLLDRRFWSEPPSTGAGCRPPPALQEGPGATGNPCVPPNVPVPHGCS